VRPLTVRARAAGRLCLARLGLVALLVLLGLLPPAGAPEAQVSLPNVTASAGLLMDLATGQVLWAKNAAEDRAPASLVKLMTLYLVYEDLGTGRVQLGDLVVVSPSAERTPRYRMGLTAGEIVTLETLLAGVAIASANDAATAIAEHVAGSEELFVERMNEVAATIGLAHTRFANAHGLPDPRQRTTAEDMARLAHSLLHDHPESREVLRQTGFVWRGRHYQRRIPLFRDPGGVDALKTGYTLEAGYNLAVAAGRAGKGLLCVVLGAETRSLSFLDAGRLLKFGFGEPVKQIKKPPRRWRLRGGPALRPRAR
jgi:D-alanyl-D-alanine carboxypeptidase